MIELTKLIGQFCEVETKDNEYEGIVNNVYSGWLELESDEKETIFIKKKRINTITLKTGLDERKNNKKLFGR